MTTATISGHKADPGCSPGPWSMDWFLDWLEISEHSVSLGPNRRHYARQVITLGSLCVVVVTAIALIIIDGQTSAILIHGLGFFFILTFGYALWERRPTQPPGRHRRIE